MLGLAVAGGIPRPPRASTPWRPTPLVYPRLLRLANSGIAGRWFGRLRADRPLISPSGDLNGEAPGTERGDDQAAAHVGGIRLRMARRTERHQAVEIEVRAPLGALDDVVDLD